jgi:hypothetical protein
MDKVETVKVQGGAEYAMVVNRVHKFKELFATGQILTELVKNDDETGEVIFKAHAVVDGVIRGTGHAMEMRGASNINKTSHIECAETSAIGRALAFGIGLMPSGAIASYEEVENAKLQQSKIAEHELTLASAVAYISQAFQTAIEEENEEGILEVLNDFKGNTPLKTAVWKTLNAEQAEFMTERAKVVAEAKKAKSAEKVAKNQAYAKEFAEKQKQKKNTEV